MKIECTEKQFRYLLESFLELAEYPKVWGKCPLAFKHCEDIPCGEITSDMCKKCMKSNVTWVITEHDRLWFDKGEDTEAILNSLEEGRLPPFNYVISDGEIKIESIQGGQVV